MQGGNHWGGPLEVTNNGGNGADGGGDQDRIAEDWDRAALRSQSFHQNNNQELDETQRSWLLGPPEAKKKNRYVDLGCVIVSKKALKWSFFSILIAFCVIGLPIIIAKTWPKHRPPPVPPDRYSQALHKALLFFNAQKCKHISHFLQFFFFIFFHVRIRTFDLSESILN